MENYVNARLSPRELEVLHYTSYGYTVDQIGEHMGIKSNTVKDYKKSIYVKLNVKSSNAAIGVAFERPILR